MKIPLNPMTPFAGARRTPGQAKNNDNCIEYVHKTVNCTVSSLPAETPLSTSFPTRRQNHRGHDGRIIIYDNLSIGGGNRKIQTSHSTNFAFYWISFHYRRCMRLRSPRMRIILGIWYADDNWQLMGWYAGQESANQRMKGKICWDGIRWRWGWDQRVGMGHEVGGSRAGTWNWLGRRWMMMWMCFVSTSVFAAC